MMISAKQPLADAAVKPKTELQRLRQIERLAKWVVEREQALSLPVSRSEVLRLFAEEVRAELSDPAPFCKNAKPKPTRRSGWINLAGHV
jgi:hypothetical protein